MTQERSQTVRLWIWRGLAVFLILVFFMVRSLTKDRLPVRVAPVVHAQLASTISTNGRVEPQQRYEVHSPIATTVKEIFVQAGDQVPAGKLLLTLDDVEARSRLAAAESAVKSAQAAVEAATHNGSQQEQQAAKADIARARLERDQARRDLEALSKLHTTGAASSSEVVAARQRLDTAEASLSALEESAQNRYSHEEIERAQAALSEAQAARQAAQQELDGTAVHAPVAGTIYSLNVARTEFIEAGKPLLEIADLSRMQVRGYFDEPEIGRLAVGQPIVIKWDAKPGQQWQGHIVRTPTAVISYGTRNVGEVLIAIDDADGGLLPDTNVTVTVTTSSEANALSMPREALHSENGKPYVYKVVGKQLQKTSVTVGTPNLTQVPILTGLVVGDVVATGTSNGVPLKEGMEIEVVR